MHCLSIKVIHLRCIETQTQKKTIRNTCWEPARVYLTRCLNHVIGSVSTWQRREATSWKHRVRFRADNKTIGRKVPDLLLFSHLLSQAGVKTGGPGWAKRVELKRERDGHVFWEEYRDGKNVRTEPAGEGWRKNTMGVERRKSSLKSGVPYSPLNGCY